MWILKCFHDTIDSFKKDLRFKNHGKKKKNEFIKKLSKSHIYTPITYIITYHLYIIYKMENTQKNMFTILTFLYSVTLCKTLYL